MQYWINHNGVQTGPVELDALKEMGLTSQAYVWCEGMADWVKITQVPELQGMYEMATVPESAAAAQSDVATQPAQSPSAGQQPQYSPVQPAPCPPTNMVWAILATIFCCIPLGIVGIYYANQVSKRYLTGDFEGAKSASDTGAWWIIAAITIGIIWRPIMLMTSGS